MADETLGRPLGDVMLEPTEIYVTAVVELMRSAVEVRGLAHITSGGLGNLLRLEAKVGYEIDDAPARASDLLADPGARVGVDAEMYEVFNMGCGFCCVWSRRGDEDAALELLRRHYPDAKRIGRATGEAG